MWIFKVCFVFDVLGNIDMKEISLGLLTWFLIKISYKNEIIVFGKSRSRFLPVSARCFIIRFLSGLHEQHNNDFFFLIFNST